MEGVKKKKRLNLLNFNYNRNPLHSPNMEQIIFQTFGKIICKAKSPPKTIAVGKNEVTQKETKDLIRILNLSPPSGGFPPSVEEAQ